MYNRSIILVYCHGSSNVIYLHNLIQSQSLNFIFRYIKKKHYQIQHGLGIDKNTVQVQRYSGYGDASATMCPGKASFASMYTRHYGHNEVRLWSKTNVRFCHYLDLFVGRYILDILTTPASKFWPTSTNKKSTFTTFEKSRTGANGN